MAVRNFTQTPSNQFYQLGLIDTNAAAENKLVTTDTTQTITTQGFKKITAHATYVKGSSTNGKFDILVDGIVMASSATSTTTGEVLTATVSCAVNSTVSLLATITGTATGASLDYARVAIVNA
jgi:hypothetical protein